MSEILTIVGKVATDPSTGRTTSGVPVTNFRLASTHRRFDAASNSWVDADTNWFSVAAFRQLAEHARASLRTGDSVIVTGRLKIRSWESNGKHGTSVDIEAEAIGHDLRWGTSSYMPRSKVIAAGREFADAGDSGSRGEQPSAQSNQPRSEANAEEIMPDEDSLGDLDVSWAQVDASTGEITEPESVVH